MPPPLGPTILPAMPGRGKLLTSVAGRPHRRAMCAAVLAFLCLSAAPAFAQKPSAFDERPPLRVPKTPYDGPQSGGKPPPLGGPAGGTPDRPTPFTDLPRVDRGGPQPDRGPPPQGRPASSGTGFIVASGRIMTNNHVVADCARMVARNAQGTRVAARVLGTDRQRDLALLEVPNDLGPPLTFRVNPPVRRGETVITYGFPLSGLLSSGPTLTSGDISALAGLRDNPANFQISAPVQPGNSGGPLLDNQGNVIGVVVSKLNAARIAEMTGGDIPQNVNFAVKGSEALTFLRANGVEPRTSASGGPPKPTADIGDVANLSTVYLQCFR